jgi:hypothetical protein
VVDTPTAAEAAAAGASASPVNLIWQRGTREKSISAIPSTTTQLF